MEVSNAEFAAKLPKKVPSIVAPPIAPELPEERKAAVAAAVDYHQTSYQLALTKIDDLQKELLSHKGDIAGYKVALEAKDAQLNDERSHRQTAMLVRDQAVAEAEKYRTICGAMLAVLRAHEIENGPLIRNAAGSNADEREQESEQ